VVAAGIGATTEAAEATFVIVVVVGVTAGVTTIEEVAAAAAAAGVMTGEVGAGPLSEASRCLLWSSCALAAALARCTNAHRCVAKWTNASMASPVLLELVSARLRSTMDRTLSVDISAEGSCSLIARSGHQGSSLTGARRSVMTLPSTWANCSGVRRTTMTWPAASTHSTKSSFSS
jgi:hypothetical protein